MPVSHIYMYLLLDADPDADDDGSIGEDITLSRDYLA